MRQRLKTAPPVHPGLVLAIGISAVSTGAIFARAADAPALVTAAYRLGLASLVLVPLAWWKAGDELRNLTTSDLKLAVLGGFFLAVHFATWISSLDHTSVANSVVLVNTNPVWVGLLAPFITKERMNRRTLMGIGASVIGGGIVGAADFAHGEGALFGDALALIGGICLAVYLLIGRTLRRKLSLLAYVTVCYGSAAVFLWGGVLVTGLPVIGFSPATWASFCGLAVVSQLIGHSSYNWALKWFGTGLVAVSLLGEPVLATAMAYVFFDEGLTLAKFVGGGLILAGICLAATGEKEKKT